MNVLVACEFSGVVRDAFRKRGHDAWSCDILDHTPGPWGRYHLKGDVLRVLTGRIPSDMMQFWPDRMPVVRKWDLLIAHPPCTFLCNSGVRWLFGGKGKTKDVKRWQAMRSGARFFRQLLDARIPYIAVENPIPHRYALKIIDRKYDQIVQPWMFGHGETKATCLWLKNLPPLKPTSVVDGREGRIHKMSPGPDRGMLRSITYTGLAEAMAAQWSNLW